MQGLFINRLTTAHETLLEAWQRYPAIHFALHLCIPFFLRFYQTPAALLMLPFLCICRTYKGTLHQFARSTTLVVSTFYFLSPVKNTPLPHSQGAAYITIDQIKPIVTFNSRSYAYSGFIKSFLTNGKFYHNLPYTFYSKKMELNANHDYFISSLSLEQSRPYHWIIKKDKYTTFSPTSRFSLTQKRYLLKQKIKALCKKHFPEKRTFYFLSAMATGDIESPILACQFQRLGLSHLLSISGFHFSLIVLFLAFITKYTAALSIQRLCTLIVTTGCFLYFGASPSIARAYLAVALFMLGVNFHKFPTPLNLLGGSFCVALLTNPYLFVHIGFQLSFAATFGILTFYSPLENLYSRLLPSRPLQDLQIFSPLHQHGYLLTTFLRKTLALSSSAQLLTLPLVLFHFQEFSYAGLLYNLFFPLGASLSLFLLLVGFVAFPVSTWVHKLNAKYTHHLLDFVSYPPKRFLYQWTFFHSHSFFVVLFFCLIILGVYLKERLKEYGLDVHQEIGSESAI